jgi:hypothetical protein
MRHNILGGFVRTVFLLNFNVGAILGLVSLDKHSMRIRVLRLVSIHYRVAFLMESYHHLRGSKLLVCI